MYWQDESDWFSDLFNEELCYQSLLPISIPHGVDGTKSCSNEFVGSTALPSMTRLSCANNYYRNWFR